MASLMIDSTTDSPKVLRLCAQFLDDLAITIERELAGPQRLPATTNDQPQAGIEGTVYAGTTPLRTWTGEGTQAQNLPRDEPPMLDPSVIFGQPAMPSPIPQSPSLATLPPLPPAGPTVLTHVPSTIPPAPGPKMPDEFDVAGMPYDNRIHTSKRTKVIAGTWKYLKGVSKEIIAKVEAQNQARRQPPHVQPVEPPAQMPLPPMQGPNIGINHAMPPAAPPPPPAAPLPPMQSAQPVAGVPGAFSAVVPLPPPVSLPPTAPPGFAPPPAAPPVQNPGQPPSALDFKTVMTKITATMGAGKLTLDQMAPFLEAKGLPPKAIVAIGDRPDIWQECIDYVEWYAKR